MKRLGYALFLLGLTTAAYSQQRPHYTQYILNNYVLNPALSGIENYTDVKISGRDQWVGLEGAPRTMYLTVHTPLGKKDYKTSATSYQVPGENPRGNAYWENYTASEPHHGVGLAIINDQSGAYNRFNANISYAYHLGLSPKTNLAAGFSAGITRIGRNLSKDNVTGDPAQGSNGNDIYRIRPDLNFGLWLYSADYFVGVSGQQIIPTKVVFEQNTMGLKLVPHLFATAGYRFLVTEDINAVPSVMLKYVSGSPTTPQFDFNMKVQYQDLFWLGGSYRFQDGYAGMIGLNVGNTFNIGYAYDFTTTALNTVSRGTHEIVVGFLLGNRYGDTCPRNIW
ncbi:MAG TPA: type IX secretion system membrane protein PorP/SprF [Flavisolibacter sp.]|nr:type IX secretion system membrane protein PorP/SprF [Flavisolibacter sp.]